MAATTPGPVHPEEPRRTINHSLTLAEAVNVLADRLDTVRHRIIFGDRASTEAMLDLAGELARLEAANRVALDAATIRDHIDGLQHRDDWTTEELLDLSGEHHRLSKMLHAAAAAVSLAA